MAIAEVIKFAGSPDSLVWKFPNEDFNATSQLIVDETHEALLVINGNAADLFGAGRRTLSVPNIPLARKLIEIPTDGKSPFPCKVFFINKVHHLELNWGVPEPITMEDPDLGIIIHIQTHGTMSISVEESRKFMLKLVGFRDKFDPDTLIKKFRGIITAHVKNFLSKMMISGKVGFLTVSQNLFELSGIVKGFLDEKFEEYGITVHSFNIEEVTVPKEDYDSVSKAKERRTSRIIEGYNWREEQQMTIAEAFAKNEGTMGSIGGAMGGFMMGSALGGGVTDIVRSAMEPAAGPSSVPPKDVAGISSPMSTVGTSPFDVQGFFSPKQENSPKPEAQNSGVCIKCGAGLPDNAKFCFECGEKVSVPMGSHCPSCGEITPPGKFCLHCGTPISRKCPQCGTAVPAGGKFCLECGERL